MATRFSILYDSPKRFFAQPTTDRAGVPILGRNQHSALGGAPTGKDAQSASASSVGEEAEVADPDEAPGGQVHISANLRNRFYCSWTYSW